MKMSLLDLARKFDETAAENSRARLAIGEEMEPLLGEEDRAKFLDRYDRCMAEPHPRPATRALEQMGFVALCKGQVRGLFGGVEGFVEEITIETTSPGARLEYLFHGAFNLLTLKQRQGVDLPCKLRVDREFNPYLETSFAFQSPADGMARIGLVFGQRKAA